MDEIWRQDYLCAGKMIIIRGANLVVFVALMASRSENVVELQTVKRHHQCYLVY